MTHKQGTIAWSCGHPKTPENTQRIGKAGKRCRICRRKIALRSWRRRYKPTGNPPGRPPIWPDCPPELQSDYKVLRRYMGAAEARETLEARG